MIRTVIVASAITVRVGIRELLSDDPQITIISEATNLVEAHEILPEVDVILWVPALTDDVTSALSELTRLRNGEANALLLIHNDLKIIEKLAKLPLRAWSLLDPDVTQAELIAAIHALNEGLIVSNPNGLNQMLTRADYSNDENSEQTELLTGRETEILQLLALGLTNKQIAARLKISAHTVKFHVSTIFGKLGTSNRVETVNSGLKKGLIVL